MVDVTKPIYGDVWANTGEKLAPDSAKIATGWIQEMMPYQYENFLQNRADTAITYLLQKGVAEWSSDQEYIANKSVVTYNGQLYMATATNTNVLPTATASWKKLSVSFGVNGAIPVSFGGTGATTAADARTNLGIGSAGVVNLPVADGLLIKQGSSLISRTIEGTPNYITVTNGDGQAGNPVINVGASVAKTDTNTSWTSTGSIKLPAGSTSEQGAATPGKIRFNNETGEFHGAYTDGWKVLAKPSTASETTIVDAGDYYTSGDVEGALQYVGDTLSNTILLFPTYAAASAAAATLPDGQIVESPNVDGNLRKYVVSGNALADLGAAETYLSGDTLTASPSWDEIPQVLGKGTTADVNAQAQALADRDEFINSELTKPTGDYDIGGFDSLSKLQSYSGPATVVTVMLTQSNGQKHSIEYQISADPTAASGAATVVDALGRRWKPCVSAAASVNSLGYRANGATPTDNQAALQATIAHAKAHSAHCAAIDINGDGEIDGTLAISGQFSNGVILNGHKARLSKNDAGNALHVFNESGNSAYLYSNRVHIKDVEVLGSTALDVIAYKQESAANVTLSGFYATRCKYGHHIYGGLSSAFYDGILRNGSVGIKAEASPANGSVPFFGSNANTFINYRIMHNDAAVEYDYNPSGSVNWIGTNFEDNNGAGNSTDGKSIIKLTQAGHQNFFGTHHESNKGQYGIYYDGLNDAKNLLIVGSEVIDAVGTVVHVNKGVLTGVGSRITNGSAVNDIYLASDTDTAATLIDTEARVSGPGVANLAALKNGRLGFGIQPIKTSPLINATAAALAKASNIFAQISSDAGGQIRWNNTAGTRTGYISVSAATGLAVVNDVTGQGTRIINPAGTFHFCRLGAKAIEPGEDNAWNAGSSAYRFSQVYAGTGTINTSDEREKTLWRNQEESEKQAALEIKAAIKAFKFTEAVNSKGDFARWHFGVGAQTVGDILRSHGLNPANYAFWCYDEWDEQQEIKDDEGNILQEYRPAGNRYGIRYDEMCMFILAAM